MLNAQVTIVIVNRNTKKLLEDCLSSLIVANKNAFVKYKIEIVVVDNGSSDKSEEMVKRKFPKIKLILNKGNNGFAKAVNQGIRLANSDSDVLLLNSDVVVPEGSLKKIIEFGRKEKAIVGPLLLRKNGLVQRSAYDIPTLSKFMWGLILGKKTRLFGFITPYDGQIKNLAEQEIGLLSSYSKYIERNISQKRVMKVGWVSGAVMYIPRVVINKVGLMDEKYFFYSDDVDYCQRAGKDGFKVLYNPEIFFYHIAGGSNISETVRKQTRKWLEESDKKYWGKWKYNLLVLIIKTAGRLYN